MPRLRLENKIVENEINSSLQTYLYDYLFEQQDLYFEYDQIFTRLNLKSRKEESPFKDFILNFNCYLNEIQNDQNKIKQLKKLRWYICFDKDNYCQKDFNYDINLEKNSTFYSNKNYNESSDEELSNDLKQKIVFQNQFYKKSDYFKEDEPKIIDFKLIEKVINGENNKLFFLLKCIHLSISSFCQQTMHYLYSTYKNEQYEFIKEYNKRYKNFIDTAILINEICENVNVTVNYLYEKILKDYPSFPKFSIFHLLLKIWYREAINKINEYDSIISILKHNILSIFLNFFSNDLDSIKMNIIFTNKHSYLDDYYIQNSIQTLTEFKDTNSTFKCFSKQNSEIKNKIICPLGSYYEDNYICYSIIEQGLNCITDTFCNEYSVYHLNLTYIETNNIYDELVSNIVDSIESKITDLYKTLIIEQKYSETKVINEIIKYFSSHFYTNRILNKLKLKIYSTVYAVLSILLTSSIKEKFKYSLRNLNIKLIYHSSNNINNGNINQSLYDKLYDELNIYSFDNEIKKLIINKFSNENFENQLVYFDLIKEVDKWFNKEKEKMLKKNKKVEKEISRKNIPIEFNEYIKSLLSFIKKPNWDTIKKVKQMQKNSLNYSINKDDDIIQINIDNFNDNNFDINEIYDINSYDFNDIII